jgi:hypothetical protein
VLLTGKAINLPPVLGGHHERAALATTVTVAVLSKELSPFAKPR